MSESVLDKIDLDEALNHHRHILERSFRDRRRVDPLAAEANARFAAWESLDRQEQTARADYDQALRTMNEAQTISFRSLDGAMRAVGLPLTEECLDLLLGAFDRWAAAGVFAEEPAVPS